MVGTQILGCLERDILLWHESESLLVFDAEYVTIRNNTRRETVEPYGKQLYSDLYVFPSSWNVGFVLTEVTTRYTVYGRNPKLPDTTPAVEAT